MADSIGGYYVLERLQRPSGERKILREISTPGRNGRAFVRISKQAPNSQLTAEFLCPDADAAEELCQDLEAMVGDPAVTVIQDGVTHDDILVLDISQLQITRMGLGVGGTWSDGSANDVHDFARIVACQFIVTRSRDPDAGGPTPPPPP